MPVKSQSSPADSLIGTFFQDSVGGFSQTDSCSKRVTV